MPKVDLASIASINSTGYPVPHNEAVQGRWCKRLAPATGLTDFGASHVVLKPGAWSSQRHWHEAEDELVVVLSGETVLIDDHGRTSMHVGDIAIFPKNDGNGHHIVNEGEVDCVFLAIGKVAQGMCHYPDIDMQFSEPTGYTREDGSHF